MADAEKSNDLKWYDGETACNSVRIAGYGSDHSVWFLYDGMFGPTWSSAESMHTYGRTSALYVRWKEFAKGNYKAVSVQGRFVGIDFHMSDFKDISTAAATASGVGSNTTTVIYGERMMDAMEAMWRANAEMEATNRVAAGEMDISDFFKEFPNNDGKEDKSNAGGRPTYSHTATHWGSELIGTSWNEWAIPPPILDRLVTFDYDAWKEQKETILDRLVTFDHDAWKEQKEIKESGPVFIRTQTNRSVNVRRIDISQQTVLGDSKDAPQSPAETRMLVRPKDQPVRMTRHVESMYEQFFRILIAQSLFSGPETEEPLAMMVGPPTTSRSYMRTAYDESAWELPHITDRATIVEMDDRDEEEVKLGKSQSLGETDAHPTTGVA